MSQVFIPIPHFKRKYELVVTHMAKHCLTLALHKDVPSPVLFNRYVDEFEKIFVRRRWGLFVFI
jgi:hypothetical protein